MMTKKDIEAITEENSKRKAILFSYYNPVTGEGSPIERKLVAYTALGKKIWYRIPVSMYEENSRLFDSINEIGSIEKLLEERSMPTDANSVTGFLQGLGAIRFRHDFEFWAYTCAKIQDKKTKQIIPFKLNFAQREVLATLEDMRLKRIPIREVVLKARQWGGSTLVQVYMAWIQLILKTNWHSAIVAQIENQARHIRGMYTRLAKEYPAQFGVVIFTPYEGSSKNRMIKSRDCIVGIGSSEEPDNLRSFDFAMCHLSEAAFWKSTLQKSAEDLAQSLRATVSGEPYTMIILESTANGVGNFFHNEWIAAAGGRSNYKAVFIPWYKIEMYQTDIKDYEEFIDWMQSQSDGYATFLWNEGATLEGIKWYFDFKRGENYSDWRMMAEYPTTDTEAFISTGQRVFAPNYVQLVRKNCIEPEFIGDLFANSQKGKKAFENIEFQLISKGQLLIWGMPDKSIDVSNRYATIVDIGGRTDDADWSVIKVFDRYWMMEGGKPEVVAVWSGHIDQDLVAWKAAQMAKFWNNALLVVESNSQNTEESESEADHYLTILDEVVKFYSNIYTRTDPEKIRKGLPVKYGFHTNRATKPMVIDELNGVLREEAYIERDKQAANEMDTFETKPNGKMGARDGCNDDHVIVTAVGLWICFKYMSTPRLIDHRNKPYSKKIISEATI